MTVHWFLKGDDTMSVTTARPSGFSPVKNLKRMQLRSGVLYGVIILLALVAFEAFNYSTTDFALKDLLGDLKFIGIRWSTILALAFCGIDFAGIARLFSPDDAHNEAKEAWYLFGAWLLAATMNAILTWWGVSMAMATHAIKSTAVINASALTNIVPVFVAIMVWVIRILVIGSLTVTGERMMGGSRSSAGSAHRNMAAPMRDGEVRNMPMNSVALSHRPMTRPASSQSFSASRRPEPSYHSVNTEASPDNNTARVL
jgi:hypothetical protein